MVKLCDDALGNGAQHGGIDQAGQQDDEFITADPCNRIGIAGLAAQNAAHLTQNRIPRRVPQGVVHGLEVIQIHMHQPERRVAHDDLRHRQIKRPAIAQARQGIGQRLFLGGGLCPLQPMVQIAQLFHHGGLGFDNIKQFHGKVSGCKIGIGQVMGPDRIGDGAAEGQVEQKPAVFCKRHCQTAQAGVRCQPQPEVHRLARPPDQGCNILDPAGTANLEH